ncbi:MAG: hypothetical protein HY701_09665 [Gemmatimonadetes bacterium]|nr:hypothetical protein [Gemmatimonadota bacterium]
MGERLAEYLGRQIGRRRFLTRTTAAAVAFVATTFSLSRTAAAVAYKCCDLCNNPTACSGYVCVWSWDCCFQGDKWRCFEHYTADQSCTGDCPAACSAAEIVGAGQCPLSPP